MDPSCLTPMVEAPSCGKVMWEIIFLANFDPLIAKCVVSHPTRDVADRIHSLDKHAVLSSDV